MPTLSAYVTMVSNNTYAQTALQTGLEGVTRQAYRIDAVSYDITFPTHGYVVASAAANLRWELMLSRRSKTAMPTIADSDVIKKFSISNSFLSAVGSAGPLDSAPEWQPRSGNEILVVEPTLYIGMTTVGAASLFSAQLRIDYTIVNISEIDRLTLLTQSLQG